MNVLVVETPAIIEQRQVIQERRYRFEQFYQSIQIHVRQLLTFEEGSKPLLKRLRHAMGDLLLNVRLFTDTNLNEPAIATSIQAVKLAVSDLLILDSKLDWSARNIQQACDAFARALQEKLPAKLSPPQDPGSINPKRMQLLDQVDELATRLTFLGDYQHGGVEERRPAIALTLALRQAVCKDLTASLNDAATLIVMVQAVKSAVSDLALLQSKITHEAGHMLRAMPSVHQQIDRIIQTLSGPPARPRSALSIKP